MLGRRGPLVVWAALDTGCWGQALNAEPILARAWGSTQEGDGWKDG